MDDLVFKAGGWMGLALLALVFAALAVDTPFAVHMVIIAVACLIVLWTRLSAADYGGMARGLLKMPPDEGVYDDDPVRWGVIATIFWGLAGLAVGLYIALQLAFPVLNLGIEYTSFGRLRPLHTSAVVFAFGGNALIATSFYVVQRTCRARLAFPGAARFVFWGYQLFLVLAATGYVTVAERPLDSAYYDRVRTEHIRIARAIEERDAEAAAAAMTEHVAFLRASGSLEQRSQFRGLTYGATRRTVAARRRKP